MTLDRLRAIWLERDRESELHFGMAFDDLATAYRVDPRLRGRGDGEAEPCASRAARHAIGIIALEALA